MKTLIFGATGGIGQAVCQAFADIGDELLLSGRNTSVLQRLAIEFAADWQAADLGREREVQMVCQAAAEHGAIDTVVYAAGTIQTQALQHTLVSSEEMWQANYWGVVWMLKHVTPLLAKDAKVYIVGADPQLKPLAQFGQYLASKAALERLLEVARLEHPNTICLVRPPAVVTPLWQHLGSKPPRHAIQPEVVAAAIVQDSQSSAYTPVLDI